MAVFLLWIAVAIIMASRTQNENELVKQKIKRQLTKHQKSALRQRLQKGEANIYTKQRRENMHNIKSSLDAASFWG